MCYKQFVCVNNKVKDVQYKVLMTFIHLPSSMHLKPKTSKDKLYNKQYHVSFKKKSFPPYHLIKYIESNCLPQGCNQNISTAELTQNY